MRQIAALPYRIEEDGSFRVMLITSRETKRWVIPKGNLIRGLPRHRAAGQEAWEEAGLTGVICPSSIGTYSYAKRRRSGAVRTADVDVFPLAVMGQDDDWPERLEREARWFTLSEAAGLVQEPGLKALIAGFRGPPQRESIITRALQRVRRTGGERIPMLKWFQALMPSQGSFFEQFEAHAATLVAGADALARLLESQDAAAIQTHAKTIVDEEHKADDIIRDVLQDVRRILVTPFDRSAITGLIGVMDDAIDQMNSFAKTITLYDVTRFQPEMRDMGGIIVEAARITAEVMPLLRSIGTNGARITELTERLVRIEGKADDIHDAGVHALYRASSEKPMEFIVGRELFSSLEKIVDRFEDVANEVQGLVIDHA
ncbi:DUF47 family protein [Sphingomonas naphthae]|uniref:DUF47 family protein n=1 Tax=Sphingomonas naphthae TaxID=1813468 RepID=A0ABY7TQC3_9SPHN|nr:DUF47 family protein [Sphingomonas naphthae]WCT75438.1 DUF47 family protein [Sphingomonas naphthae]